MPKQANASGESVQNGDPKLGMTNTNAPLVVKDKVLTGISGGEFGVRGFFAAYNISTANWRGKATASGPTKNLIDPKNNGMERRQSPAGRRIQARTWKGDQWKIGGGTTWGWYSYDPKLNLVYYGRATLQRGTRYSVLAITNGPCHYLGAMRRHR